VSEFPVKQSFLDLAPDWGVRADTGRGHLDSLILSVVEKEPLHGYASGGTASTKREGTWMCRLERAGYLKSEWRARKRPSTCARATTWRIGPKL
jgi:hypothetical protein